MDVLNTRDGHLPPLGCRRGSGVLNAPEGHLPPPRFRRRTGVAGARAAASALCLAALSCGTLTEPAAEQPLRCARPCPPGCAECLPTGFCARAVRTAAQLGLSAQPEGGSWTLRAEGFPPRAAVTCTLAAGVDMAAREGREPFAISVTLHGAPDLTLVYQSTYASFPAWAAADGSATSDDAGGVALPVGVVNCRATAPSTCTLDPASTFTVSLVNTQPWLQAPPCE